MVNLYAFELGRKNELCFQELIAVLGEKNLVERGSDTAIFKIQVPNAQRLQDELGGTIKIVQLLCESSEKDIKSNAEKIIREHFRSHKGKIPFSVTTLNFKKHTKVNIKELLIFSKKVLKSLNLNSRFVNQNFQNTKPSTIFKAKVVEKGIDLNIIQGKHTLYIGKTVSIQDINAYSERDFYKPKRDAKIGMLPPKLAQIMINLAGNKLKTIYDPFCGTGTILMEGLLMGLTVVGSDIDNRLVNYTFENCEWLNKNHRDKINTSFNVFQRDAQFLTKETMNCDPDAIITEGYLGKPMSKEPTTEEMEVQFREMANLHLNWLTKANQVTNKNCTIVMCKTGYHIGDSIIHFPRFEEIALNAGYEVVKTYTYDRPDQIVIRDIAILKKL